MVERRELINVFRQIGIMMGAGVDFLRITQVLRAQTENPRLADLYNNLDHDLTMGMSLADAMARQPDIFSPFAVSLVRQTEMRSDMAEMSQDLAAAFLRVADYLQQEAAPARMRGHYNAAPIEAVPTTSDARPASAPGLAAPAAPPVVSVQLAPSYEVEPGALAHAFEHWRAELRLIALRALLFFCLFCTALTALASCVALGWLAARWWSVGLWGLGALFSGVATCWLWQYKAWHNNLPTSGILEATRRAASQNAGAASYEEPVVETPSRPAPAVPNDAGLEGSWDAGSDENAETATLDTAAPFSSMPNPTPGNWADLKRVARPSNLPLWAREEEAANLPPLPPESEQFLTPPSANPAPPAPAQPQEEADYE